MTELCDLPHEILLNEILPNLDIDSIIAYTTTTKSNICNSNFWVTLFRNLNTKERQYALRRMIWFGRVEIIPIVIQNPQWFDQKTIKRAILYLMEQDLPYKELQKLVNGPIITKLTLNSLKTFLDSFKSNPSVLDLSTNKKSLLTITNKFKDDIDYLANVLVNKLTQQQVKRIYTMSNNDTLKLKLRDGLL